MKEFTRKKKKLNVLINNAAMAPNFKDTNRKINNEGNEITMATNYLGKLICLSWFRDHSRYVLRQWETTLHCKRRLSLAEPIPRMMPAMWGLEITNGNLSERKVNCKNYLCECTYHPQVCNIYNLMSKTFCQNYTVIWWIPAACKYSTCPTVISMA